MGTGTTPGATSSSPGRNASLPWRAACAAEYFGHFDLSGITVQEPARTFTGRLEVEVRKWSSRSSWGSGHSHADVAVHVPHDGVIFAGDAL
ncbi:MBL fold metallo-hydrolase [Streptomyces sp. NPDC091272]|uniref:MBL fold metallo-hydrolase n=1 Tax=Streptomyces sp. NPDC091272 TaxID=3365981 RepID=UPI0037F34B3A